MTSARERGVDAALATVLGAVALGPLLLHRGVALRGDMVFVPRQPWKGAWLGLDGAVPRFVPGDALVSAATTVVPGDILQKLVLLGALVLAGTGAGRLVGGHGALPRAAAIVLVTWNPWVLERLSIGQWGSVVGYAALPWLARAAARLRDDPRRGWPATVAWLGFTALWSPAAGLVGTLTALCVVVVRPRARTVGVVLGGALVANLPWLAPSLLVSQLRAPAGGEFGAFAARAESSAGLLPSLLSLGGIWKASVVPSERTMALVVLLACVPTVVALVALRTRSSTGDTGEGVRGRLGLGLLAAVCFLVVLLPAIGAVGDALDRAAARVPAVGMVRDSDRYLGPVVLLLAVGLAAATAWLLERARSRTPALRLVAVLLVAWPVLCLPSMAWGLGGALHPVSYPAEWHQVAGLLHGDDTTVVLPWRGGYRGFAWNGHHAALDPAPRYFRGDVLIDDRLYLDDGAAALGNEDPRLAAVTRALATPDPASSLRAIGVDHVLLEKGNGTGTAGLPAGRTVHDGPGLTLVDLGAAKGTLPGSRPPAWAVVGADAVAGLALLVSGLYAIGRRTYRV